MDVSVMAYPWDVARLGAREVVDELVALDVSTVALAATYHPIDTFSPRTPEARLFSLSGGAVLFPPAASRYERIRPRVADPSVLDAWPELASCATERGLALDAWTIALYQPWIAQDYPDCARELVTGERLSSGGACPASPDVRAYLAALLGDVVENFGVRRIRLEGVAFRSFDHGWPRPRIVHEVSVAAAWLLGLCFCLSCRSRARSAGVDDEGLRRRTLARLSGALASPDAGRSEIGMWMADDAELRRFVANRNSAVIEIVEAATATPAEVVLTIPADPAHPGDIDVADVIDLVGGVMVHPALGPDLTREIGHTCRSGPEPKRVVSYLAPAGRGDQRLENRREAIRAAEMLPVDEISIYNYGLLSRQELAEITLAARAARSDRPCREVGG